MENGGFFDALSTSEEIITLLQVSQSLSSSSTSTDQSRSIGNASESLLNPSRNLNEKIQQIPRRKWDWKLRRIWWNRYIRWDLLFSFGFVLWVALCLADSVCPRTIYIMQERKLKVEGPRDLEVYWTLKCFFYISHYVLPNLRETFMFLVVFGVFAVLENCMKKKWFNQSQNITKIGSTPLLSIYHERDFLFDGLEDSEHTHDSEYPEEIDYIKKEEGRKLRIHPELYWHWRLFRGIAEVTTRIKRKSKGLNKLGLHTSTSETKGLLNYDLLDQGSIQPYETYDQEIYRFIKTTKKSSTTAFDDVIAGLQKTERKHSTWISGSQNINPRIISSSPAFKDFLSKLKKNPPPCNKLTF